MNTQPTLEVTVQEYVPEPLTLIVCVVSHDDHNKVFGYTFEQTFTFG